MKSNGQSHPTFFNQQNQTLGEASCDVPHKVQVQQYHRDEIFHHWAQWNEQEQFLWNFSDVVE